MDHVDPVRWCLVAIAPRARCRTGPGTTEQGSMMSETKADKATRPVRFDWERGLLASALPFEVKAVGLALATYAGRSGELWPSNDRLARNMSASKRTIQRHSKSLRQSGWIAKSNKPGSSGTNRLRLTIPPSAPAGVADAALDRACDAGADPEGVTPVTEGVTPVTELATPVSSNCDTAVTQTGLRKGLHHFPASPGEFKKPSKVSSATWEAVRPVLGAIVSAEVDDGKRFTADWASLAAKPQLCHYIEQLLSVMQQRAIVDALTEGGLTSFDHPARVVFSRAKTSVDRYEGGFPIGNASGAGLVDGLVAELCARLNGHDLMHGPEPFRYSTVPSE